MNREKTFTSCQRSRAPVAPDRVRTPAGPGGRKNSIAPVLPTQVAKLSLKRTCPGTKRWLWDSSWMIVATSSTSSRRTMVDSNGSENHPSVLKAEVGLSRVS